MNRIEYLIDKGWDNVSKDELAEIRRLALIAQHYLAGEYVIKVPSILFGMIVMRLYEMTLKKKYIANKLKVSDAKTSLITNCKQKLYVYFLKAVHT